MGVPQRRAPSARVAAWLSVVPGLGQLYNGQVVKAALYFGGSLLTLAPAVVLITRGEGIGHTLLSAHAYAVFFLVAFASVLVFLALFVIGLFIWASAVVDARRSAEAMSAGRADEAAQNWFFRL
jgi:arabinogalactan oligomer/maltooligosaccharide transport system permease protein